MLIALFRFVTFIQISWLMTLSVIRLAMCWHMINWQKKLNSWFKSSSELMFVIILLEPTLDKSFLSYVLWFNERKLQVNCRIHFLFLLTFFFVENHVNVPFILILFSLYYLFQQFLFLSKIRRKCGRIFNDTQYNRFSMKW